MINITVLDMELDSRFERADTPRTNADQHNMGSVAEPHYVVDVDCSRQLERELVAARTEADAMDEFLGAASRHEKEASAIIKSLTADIHITVPIRDYSEMSPKDCYELGMMDGVAALKAQINAAIDAAIQD